MGDSKVAFDAATMVVFNDDGPYFIALQHFLHQRPKPMHLVIVNGDAHHSFLGKICLANRQAILQETQPRTMFVPILIDYFSCIRVVWWINVDALYLSLVTRLQQVQSLEVFTVYKKTIHQVVQITESR